MDFMNFLTPDQTLSNIEKIEQIFPSAITEMRDENGNLKKGINFETLKQLLSSDVVDGAECYEFTWVGKKAAMAEAARPITKTLRPVKEDSRDWETTENLYIEGDNLEVLKILQESYLGKVKMIYIDPPYNRGHDFIYPDSFVMNSEEYNNGTNYFDENGYVNFFRENNRSCGKYHSDWCSMMYSRLSVARNLLSKDGSVFISIDDNEIDNLIKICNEIYGEENFIAIINWKGRGGRQDSKYFAAVHEYILCFAKSKNEFVAGEEIKSGDIYPKYDKDKGKYYKTQLLRKWGANSRREDRPNLYYSILAPDGTEVYPIIKMKDNSGYIEGCWRHGKETMEKNLTQGKVEFVKQQDGSWIPYEKILRPLREKKKQKSIQLGLKK